MSDFILLDYDYINCIIDKESLSLFERMKWLMENELHKPAAQCVEAIKEWTQLDRKLRGVKPAVFIDGTRPNLN